MALIVPKIQKDMEKAIVSAMTNAFSDSKDADPDAYKKFASALAEGITKTIVSALQQDAEVIPGIATAGSPSAQSSVTPGKIF